MRCLHAPRNSGRKQPISINDEADVIQEVSIEPAAPGLDLICRGLRRISADNLEAIARGALVYDALYADLSRTHAGHVKRFPSGALATPAPICGRAL
jgi:hypothetical protein